MGWVMMSERELNRVEVLAQVDDGRLSVDNAANMLDLTRRQIFRLLKRYRQDGAAAIRHRSRGKIPNNQIHRAKRDYALSLIKESYPDFGPTLAVEMLAQHHGFKVSRETLRKWMVEDGIWLSRKQRRQFHQPRLRRECFGELIQPLGTLLRNTLSVNGSMAQIIVGLRIVLVPAPCSSSSTMPPVP